MRAPSQWRGGFRAVEASINDDEPYTADIGDGIENFETLADVQRALRARASGGRFSAEWYRRMGSRHGANVCDASGTRSSTWSPTVGVGTELASSNNLPSTYQI